MGNTITKLLAYVFCGMGITLICKGAGLSLEYPLYISLVFVLVVEVGTMLYHDLKGKDEK